MRTLALALAAAFAFLPSLAAAAEPALTPEGYDWLRIGMSADDAAAASPREPELAEGEDLSVCAEYALDPAGAVVYMTSEMWVSRISVHDPGPTTPEGVQVGDTAARVRAAYGDKVEREPAPYAAAPAEDLYVWLTPDRGYRFEVDDKGVVRTIHAGSESIRLIEGCL